MLASTGGRLAAQPGPAAASSSSRRLAPRCQAAGLGGPPLQPGRQRVREQSPSKSRAAAAAAAAAAQLEAAAAATGGKPAAPLPPLQPPQAGNVVPITLPKEEWLQQLERHYSLPAVPDLDVLQEAEHWRQRQQRQQEQQQAEQPVEQQQEQQQAEQPVEQQQEQQVDNDAAAAVAERQRLAGEASTSGRGMAALRQQRSGEIVASTRSGRGRTASAAAARRHSSLPDSESVVTCWLHDCATRHTRGQATAAAPAAPAAPAAAAAAAAARRRLLQPGAHPAVPAAHGVTEETCQDMMVLVAARASLRAGRRRKPGKPGTAPGSGESAMGHYMRSLGNTGVLGRAQEVRLAEILQKGRALEELATRLAAQTAGDSSSSRSSSGSSSSGAAKGKAGGRAAQLPVSDEQVAAAAGLSVAEVVQRRTNQREAKDLLMQHNTRLVINIAKRYTNSGVPLADLIPEGMAGLSKSLDRFEPSRGFKFSTYSHWWIRQAISRAVCDQARTVRLPGHICEQLARINRAASAMMEQSESDEFPSYEALAKEVGLPVNRVIHYLRLSRLPGGPATPGGGPASAGSQPLANGPMLYGASMKELRPLGDELHDDPEDGWWGDEPEGEAEAAAEFIQGVVDVMLSTLDKRERNVLRLRYGLLGRQQLLGDGVDGEGSDAASMSLGEVAEAYGLSRERIRQIEDKALKALRKPWRQELVRKLAFAEACGGGGHDSAMAQAQAELADEQGGYSWLERRS